MSSTRPSVLVLTFGPLEFDSRVKRQIASLSEHFSVTLVAPRTEGDGWWKEVDELLPVDYQRKGFVDWLFRTPFIRAVMGLLLYVRSYSVFYWSPRYSPFWVKKTIIGMNKKFDLIVVNDADPLPLAVSVAKGAPIVADLHEFAPGQDYGETEHQRAMSHYWSWICRRYVHHCRGVTVVSDSVRDLYREAFGFDSKVIRSTPDFVDIRPTPAVQDDIQFVHHGFYSPYRGIELVIDAFGKAHNSGVLHLVLSEAPIERLKARAVSAGIPEDKIVFHDFVPPDKVVAFLNSFDVEIIFIPTDVVNEQAALPNKFFEAVQARLGIISGPSAEIVRVVEGEGIGHIVPSYDPAHLADALLSVSAKTVTQWKKRSDSLAHRLNWQQEAPDYRDYLND